MGMDGVQVACLEMVLVVLKWKLMLPKKHGNVKVSSRRVHFQNSQFSVAPPQKKQFILGLPPNQVDSHHQDYSIFSRESQPKPSFVTGIPGGR